MYKIEFEDGEIFVGGNDIKDSGWNKMPNRLIKKLHYKLLGIKLELENFEEYNHIVCYRHLILNHIHEAYQVMVMAKKGDKVRSFIFDIKNKKFGQVINSINELQKATGWKKGLKGKNTHYKITNP